MFESTSTADLVESISAGARQESMLIATRMARSPNYWGRRTAEAEAEDPDCGYMIITGLQRTSAEVGAALNLPPRSASDMVSHADALDIRLPKIAALLARGAVDWNIVRPILAHTELLSDQAAAAVDDDLAERISHWHCWSRRRIINAVDVTVRAKDPDACRERERGENRRYLRIIARRDGTAKVDGVITAEAAAALGTKVSALTDGVCSQDPRTLDQRRADSVLPLAAGQTMACTCGRPDCGSATEKTCAPTRIVINLLADANTARMHPTRRALRPRPHRAVQSRRPHCRGSHRAGESQMLVPCTSPREDLRRGLARCPTRRRDGRVDLTDRSGLPHVSRGCGPVPAVRPHRLPGTGSTAAQQIRSQRCPQTAEQDEESAAAPGQ